MLLREDPNGPWRRHDFILLEALQIMEQERCPQCGLPRWMCHDETGGVQFSVEEDECVAKRAIDKRHDEDSKKEKKNHGISLYPSPYFVDGYTPLDIRDEFYRAEERRYEELAESRE